MATRSRMRTSGGGKGHQLLGGVLGALFGAPELTDEAAAYLDPSGFEEFEAATTGRLVEAPAAPPTQMYKEPGFARRVFDPVGAGAITDANMGTAQELFSNTAREYLAERARRGRVTERRADIAKAYPGQDPGVLETRAGTGAEVSGMDTALFEADEAAFKREKLKAEQAGYDSATATEIARIQQQTLKEQAQGALEDLPTIRDSIRNPAKLASETARFSLRQLLDQEAGYNPEDEMITFGADQRAKRFGAQNRLTEAAQIIPTQQSQFMQSLAEKDKLWNIGAEIRRKRLEEELSSLPMEFGARRWGIANPDAGFGGNWQLNLDESIPSSTFRANPSAETRGGGAGLADFIRSKATPTGDGTLEGLTPDEQEFLRQQQELERQRKLRELGGSNTRGGGTGLNPLF